MKAALHSATVVRTVAAVVLLASLLVRAPAVAQDEPANPLWSEPVNLSRSGSASKPLVAAAPGDDGVVQAFWWDRFDGVTTAIYDPVRAEWQPAAPAPIVLTSVVGEGDRAQVVRELIGAMPGLVVDTTGRVHAFWFGPTTRETGLQPQLLSHLRLGTTSWTEPSAVSESVSGWAMDSTARGVLHLAYVRPIESDRFPAGIYYTRSTDNGATWSTLHILVPSRYFRLYSAEQINLSVHAGDDGGVFIAWDDPRLGAAYMLASRDGGETWTVPAPAAGPGVSAEDVRFVQLDNAPDSAPTLLWRDTSAFSGCVLYQQPLVARPGDEDPQAAPTRIVAELNSCPVGLRSLGTTAADQARSLLISGEGTSTLTLFGWDGDSYSLPTPLSFNFADPETGARVYLSDLQATLTAGGQLVVVGASDAGASESTGEIWALQTTVSALDVAFAPPSPWSARVVVGTAPRETLAPGAPATAIDLSGRLHLLWTEGAALKYSRRDTDGRFSQPVTVATATGATGSPTLLALGDRLHAVWAQGSGPGAIGEVVYSSAYTGDAYAAGTWTTPQALSLPGMAAAAPALTTDANGAFHVLFAVPLNEERGVYYTRSIDLGASWTEPGIVFDATQPPAGSGTWPMVDHTALAADGAGTLHALFVEGSAHGPFPARGLWTSRSTDGGESWSSLFLIAEGAAAHPRIAAVGAQLLVLWQDAARGTLSTRTSADYGNTWSYQQAVPGFRSAVEPGAAALLTGGLQAMTLVGLTHDFANAPALQTSAWDGARWTPIDTLKLSDPPLPGAGAALEPDGSRLHVFSWAAGEGDTRTLSHSERSLSGGAVQQPEAQAPVPLPPTPTPTPGPTPTPVPTPRPTVNAAPPREGTRTVSADPLTLPLAAIGGIAGVAVLVLGAVLIVGRKR
jgi:hypothetical protein